MMRYLVFSCVVLLMAGCAGTMETVEEPELDPAQVLQQLEASNSAFLQAFNSHDAETLAGYYTEDATFMPQGAPAVTGRQAIQQFLAGLFEGFSPSDMTLTIDRIEIHGDAVVDIGEYSMIVNPPGQDEPVEDKGKYVVLWKQVEGEWKLHIDIFNANSSPTDAASQDSSEE